MEEKEKRDWLKLRKQFFHRRDVVEGTDIKSLPQSLIEAVKNILNKKPEKIKFKNDLDDKWKRSHVLLHPKKDGV